MELALPPSSRFADRLAGIRAAILESGRDPAGITVVAVTKGRPLEDCREAAAAGMTVMAENRVAEGLERMAALPAIEWHLIGHLQGNKVRHAAGRFALVHSVDSEALAESIAARAPAQPVLLQVNISGEPGKHGFRPAEVAVACRAVARLLPVRGLMGMAAQKGEPGPAFDLLAGLRRQCEEEIGSPLPVLSMGMSGDYRAALTAGSTMLRLGRALFG